MKDGLRTLKLRDPFWQTSLTLLRYKKQLGLAFLGAVISAACFGTGLGMVLPTLQLLLGQKKPLHELVDQFLTNPKNPQMVQDLAVWLTPRLPHDPLYGFLAVMGTIAALTAIGSCGRYLHELLTLTVVARAGLAWRADMFRRLVHARLDHVLVKGSADYISRLTYDCAVLSRGHYAILGKTVAKVFNGVAALGVAVWLDWRLSMIAMVCTPGMAALLRKFGRRIRRASRRLMQQRGGMIAMLNESLGGLRVVKVHHAEGYERRRFGRINRAVYLEEMRMRQARALSGPVVETLALLGVVAVASIAAWYIFRLNVPPERFMTVLIALGASAASLKPVSELNNQLQESAAAAARMIEVMEIPVEPIGRAAGAGKPILKPHRQEIAFEDIGFTYPGQVAPAVQGVSLRVRHGQTVAFVGTNGSGKTTLLSLLPRLLEPTTGRVLIDGVDIATVNLLSLRRQIAVVTQQSVLFQGTIAQNIAYGRLYESKEKIVAAAKAAYAHEFVTALPDGYDTVLGEGGEGLSGGQRQRLCIARAILRNPAVLILDEATSQIDAESEANINQALAQFRHGRTTLVIAHRLSTVVDADLIVVMADGRIVDRGTHAQLLANCDIYQALTHSQLKPASSAVIGKDIASRVERRVINPAQP